MKTETPAAPPAREIRKIQPERQTCRIRISPCGQFLFGGCYDGLIRRWDITVDEPQELDAIPGHKGWVQSVEFSPDGETLFSVDSWGKLAAWPYRDEKPDARWQVETAHDGWIRAVAVSADGSLVATTGRDRFVRVWSAKDGKLVREFPRQEHDLFQVAIHPDGKSVVCADLFGTLKQFNIETGNCDRELKLEEMHYYERIQDVPGVYVLEFDESGETLICAGGQPTRTGNHQGIPTLNLIDWEKFEVRTNRTYGVANDGFIFDLAWHKDGYFAAVTSGNPGAGQFLLMRPEEDKAFFLEKKMSNVHSLALHPDQKTVIVAATNRNSQGNGAVRTKDGAYVANTSPLHVFELADPAVSKSPS